MNHVLFRQKLFAAISEMSGRQDSDVVIRPSSIGNCPLRLWFQVNDSDPNREGKPAKYDWYSLQGVVHEELMGELLEMAGAEVAHPPHNEDTVGKVEVGRDPETGMIPHIDRLIRWPEIGINDWSVLEIKDLRAMAHIALFKHDLPAGEFNYWCQSVSYLMLAPLAIKLYAQAERETFSPGIWCELEAQGVVPEQLIFFSAAKDPSTANMLFRGQTKQTKKELNTPEKMTDEEKLKARLKAELRDRAEELDGIDFFTEVYHRDQEDVQDAWDYIQSVPKMVLSDQPPVPRVRIETVPEEDLPSECAFYCPYFEKHMQLAQKQMWSSDAEVWERFDR